MEKTTISYLRLEMDDESVEITLPYSVEVYKGNALFTLSQIITGLMNKVKALEDKIKDLE